MENLPSQKTTNAQSTASVENFEELVKEAFVKEVMNTTGLKLQKTTTDYSVATIGNLAEFSGKAFVKEIMGATGLEVSFGTLAPGQAVPFFHKHQQNEELYIVIRGKGTFTLDDDEVEVSSGSVVRIAPQVSRCNKCTGDEPLMYICIQVKANSLEQYNMADGIIEQK